MSNMERRQIGGFFLSPQWISDPERAKPYIQEMVEHGYVAAHAIVWHLKMTVLDKRVHDAVQRITDIAHEHGLGIILNTDHDTWGVLLAQEHPETALSIVRSVEVRVHEGRFETCVRFPNAIGKNVEFEDIAAVFMPTPEGYRQLVEEDVSYDWMNLGNPPGVQVKGAVANRYSGKLVVYAGFTSHHLVDVAHPLYLEAQERLLDLYADVPLDGVAWDEPGKGVRELCSYRLGQPLLDRFRTLHGYDLKPKLIYLDHSDHTGQSAKVRCDYRRTLTDINYVAQRKHNDYARKLYPDRELILGTHQTWSGLPPDLASGVMDYFKLGEVLTASWTDGSMDLPLKFIAFHYMLAEGLKKELGFRDAYYNDWTYNLPAVENMRFTNRFKKLFHVNWYNHCFGDFSENLVNFRLDPLRTAAMRDAQDLNAFDSMVTDRFSPQTDVALLYAWEGIAAEPKVVRMFYTALANASLHLAERGLYASMMSAKSILAAEIQDGGFRIGRHLYRVLIVPYAGAISGPAYEKIMAMSEGGVPVVFFGPPPEFIAESGEEIRDAFAEHVGMQPLGGRTYLDAYAEQNGMPDPDAIEPPWVDFDCPISVTTGVRSEDREGRTVTVKAVDKPLYYMPLPDPREALVNLVELWTRSAAEVFSDGAYWRFYTTPEQSGEAVLVVAGKSHIAAIGISTGQYEQGHRPPVIPRPLKLLMRGFGGELTIRGGDWCAVHLKDGAVVESIGNCPDIQWTPIEAKGREAS